MKGLLAKDLLTIKNKYGIKRIIMDICIMATLMIFLKGTGAIYISFLLIPIEIMTMIISLTTCDEQWKWNKYVVALPVSKTTIVKSRYIFAFIMSCVGFVVALAINLITYFCFPQFAFGYYLSIITGPYFNEARDAISIATTNITNGADLEKELKKTEDTVNFNMGQ